jgi:hypothetical protein
VSGAQLSKLEEAAELDRATLTPRRDVIDTTRPGDYGADPLGNGTFRMVPSGDVVDLAEMRRRLAYQQRR